ncbi:uncharacterized protein MYCFIDRAFT_215133 [Pseudocercospora fijiensis CIRAD86]|uniref:Uncharacterized protein n=1 Tax=Pseudocercospora fijiensis (strain CIRAD86) TaxID=383855 RepID=M2ZV88_PSEFD|nr:uncharacterized protein MYCFIDRAFT_215133 [Pseudocercospora fijiensis CIRAD86]EME82919.1 hypothetical protein MYCFIDRAFT_215133 [Pseudocercospora fijiensis CIRAD86]
MLILVLLLGLSASIVSATTLQRRDYAQTDFFSAIHRNICSEVNDKQHSYHTESCECTATNALRASCRSATNELHQHIRQCSTQNRNVKCFPSENSPKTGPDCACKPEERKSGVKLPNDSNDIACTGGVHFLAAYATEVEAIDVWSDIRASPNNNVITCWVQDNRGRTLTSYAPCNYAGGVPLRIPLHGAGGQDVATYQACIQTTTNDRERVNISWVLTSPFGQTQKRDELTAGISLREAVDYDDSAATSDVQGNIVVRNGHGDEIFFPNKG